MELCIVWEEITMLNLVDKTTYAILCQLIMAIPDPP